MGKENKVSTILLNAMVNPGRQVILEVLIFPVTGYDLVWR